ncbi:exocyst complex component EXO70H1-like [Rhodamnia argentea]|uniref:Exocyst subunit Exo70 family protein n=1 Tax=Rhodamnia argentea TaxID=178133 RepID=A0A8B8Q698_9MYRT|nr:exocyst complex component EXO70H1-like [Rhodamnia argentea]
MRGLCFRSPTPSLPPPPRTPRAASPVARRLSDSSAENVVESSAAAIAKWDPESRSPRARVASIFLEDRAEALQFLQCVHDLRKAMDSLPSENSGSEMLLQGQRSMQIAMKRLQKELYHVLSLDGACLDPGSISVRSSGSICDSDSGGEGLRPPSMATTDLRSIVECMISSGYAKECIAMYTVVRKWVVDEAIRRLGVEKFGASQVKTMDWEVLEVKVKLWIDAVKVAMTSLFAGERILCDHSFFASDSIGELCFAEICGDGAARLFKFPAIIARRSTKSPEKIFLLLDMYAAISENWLEIESMFTFDSTSGIRSQALASLVRLGESVRAMLTEFKSTIHKDSSKSVVAGGGVHRLTVYTMDHLYRLAAYGNTLAEIVADWSPPAKPSLPEDYFEGSHSDEAPAPAISLQMAWLILVLLRKLEGKAEQYRDVSVSYLFLANNLQHIISKVRASNLRYLLGEEWVARHGRKLRQFAENHERITWGEVGASLPEDPRAAISPAEASERFRRFNARFEEACGREATRVVADLKLREEMRASLERKVVRAYGEFYDAHWLTVGGETSGATSIKYTPEDVGYYLAGLFSESAVSGIESWPSPSPSPAFSGSSPSLSSGRWHPRTQLRESLVPRGIST